MTTLTETLSTFCNMNGLEIIPGTINPGDLYIAMRNTGPHIFVALKIRDGYIIPDGGGYFYDIGECFKVEWK